MGLSTTRGASTKTSAERGLALPWAATALALGGNVVLGFTVACLARTRTGEPGASASTGDVAAGDAPALLPADENNSFQRRWEELQTAFVDDPRRTVEQADELVAQVMQRLAEGFAAEREQLEAQWGRGEDISTEDLRVALQRYRAFFQRLLSA